MQGITLVIGILGSILVLSLRPVYALGAYFGVLIWYPDYLRVSIGTIDISVGRIVVTVLLLRCLFDEGIRRKLIWSRFDTLVTLSMVVYVGMYCATRPFLPALENRGGLLMDTWLSYLCVRLCITDRASMIVVIKFIAITLVPLAVLGVIEAVTGTYAYKNLHQYCSWRPDVVVYDTRWGFSRAWGPFGHPVMFGSCFVMFLPLIWTLRHQHGPWGKLSYPLSGIAALGVFSSMSSGPWSMLIATVFCLVMERYKRWVKAVFISMVLSCIFIAIASNSPLHRVLLSRANIGGGDWWQRSVIIDAAIEDFGEWWFAGYGDKDPGWGSRTGAGYTDMNNEFIKAGVQYGILGIIALSVVFIVALIRLVRTGRQTVDVELTSLYWALGSAIVGIIVVMQGVSLFGQMNAFFYCMLGIVGSSTVFAKHMKVGSRGLFEIVPTNTVISRTR